MSCVIYNIRHEGKVIYVGSTTNFKRRIIEHKYACKRRYNENVYKFINRVGWDNVEFNIVAYCHYDNRYKMEGYFYNLDKDTCLNKEIPGRDMKKYLQDYRIINKEKIQKYNQERVLCLCGKIYTQYNKYHHYKTKFHKENI